MALPLLLLETELSGTDEEHLMTVETLFYKDAILDMDMLLKINYFDTGKG